MHSQAMHSTSFIFCQHSPCLHGANFIPCEFTIVIVIRSNTFPHAHAFVPQALHSGSMQHIRVSRVAFAPMQLHSRSAAAHYLHIHTNCMQPHRWSRQTLPGAQTKGGRLSQASSAARAAMLQSISATQNMQHGRRRSAEHDRYSNSTGDARKRSGDGIGILFYGGKS